MDKKLGLIFALLLTSCAATTAQAPTTPVAPDPVVSPPTDAAQAAPTVAKAVPTAFPAPDASRIPAPQRQQIEKIVLQALAKPSVVEIGKSPIRGPVNAPLTLIEFADFQCPHCAEARSMYIEPMFKKYGTKLRLVYKNFPLTQVHPFAFDASKAAWAAQQQGKFFPFYEQLFEHQEQLNDAKFIELARQLKLDVNKFNSDRKSPAAEAQVKQDMAQGQAIEIQGTPTFVLNGVEFQAGTPLDAVDVIVEVLKKKQNLKI